MKNLLHFSVVSLMVLVLATSCKKENIIPSRPALQTQVEENDLFYFEGSSALFADYQMAYYYRNGQFNDPAYNHNCYPAQNFTLINDSTLQIHIKSLYTGAETDIIAHKVPLKYNNYGIAGWTDDLTNIYCVFNGLIRCPEKNFCQSLEILYYYLANYLGKFLIKSNVYFLGDCKSILV